MEQNPNETLSRMGLIRLRQQNLQECYKNAKISKFRFPSPFNVTVKPIQIDSDSEEEKEQTPIVLHRETKKEILIKLENPKILTQSSQVRKRIIFDETNNKSLTKPKAIKISISSNNTTNDSFKEIKIFPTVASKEYLQSLLSPEEKFILNRIIRINSHYQMFLLKLYSEKYEWHNVFQFCEKNNIKDDNDIVEFLNQRRFIDIDNDTMKDMDIYELLQKLDQKKLKEIIKDNKIITCRKYSNQGMIDSIACACTNQKTLTGQSYKDKIMAAIKKKFGFNIKLQHNVYEAIKSVYILETIFINQISVKDYIKIITTNNTLPKVPLEEYPIFASRDDFLNYTKAKNLQQEFENILNTNNVIRAQKASAIRDLGEEIYNELRAMDFQNSHPNAPYMNKFTDQFIYIDLLTKCYARIYTIYTIEGKKWLEYLIDHFPNSKKFGHWNYQLIWLYMRHLEEIDLKSATRLLVQVFSSSSDKLSESDKHNLAYLSQILKLNKLQINEIFFERIFEMAPAPINMSVFLQEEFSSETNVTRKINKETGFTHLEEVALNHYRKIYSEGKNCQIMMSTLFVVYFWDILYNPVKNPTGVFMSELQSAPLDLQDEYFYLNRKQSIDSRLKDIQEVWSTKQFIEFGVSNFKNNCLYKSCFQLLVQDCNLTKSGVAADIPDVAVGEIAGSIGPIVLGKIFERLVKDLSDSIINMPSLLVWNPIDKHCKFVEVKNSRAKTPVERLIWLQYLQSIGAWVEIFNIKNPSKKNDTTIIKSEESSTSEEED